MDKPITDAYQGNLKTITDALALRPRGNILSQCSTDEIVAACSPRPPRLLLSHGMCTKLSSQMEQKFMVRNGISFFAGWGFLPAAFIAIVMLEKGHSLTECLGVLLLLMFGLVAFGYWQGIRVPSRPVFQTAEWLDFTSHTWHTCTIYPGSDQPPVERSLPFSRLIIVCFSESWVDSNEEEYIVALCEADRFMNRTRDVKDIIMIKLHEAESEQAAVNFARKLAQLWSLPAWQDQLDRDYKHVSVRLDIQKKRQPQRRH